MLLVAERRVINNGFIVKFHERINHQAGRLGIQLGFLGLNDRVQVLNNDTLGGTLGGNFALHDLSFFLITLVDDEPLRFEVAHNHVQAIGRILH